MFAAGDVVVAGVALTVGGACVAIARDEWRRLRLWQRARTRVERAEMAAAEASVEDEMFAPESIRAAVIAIVSVAVGGELGEAEREDEAVVVDWARSHGLRSGCRLVGVPSVHVMRVANRAGGLEDRVDVRVRCHFAPSATKHAVTCDERWVIGRSRGAWVLREFSSDPLAEPVLAGALIPGGWADEDGLRDESFIELAAGDGVAATAQLGELADRDDDPAAALRDLSVIDGRYAPAVIEAELNRLIEAWEQATTGSPEPLVRLASAEARVSLLEARAFGKPVAIVLRDATLARWSATHPALTSEPPRLELMVHARGVRYLVDPQTRQHVSGNRDWPHDMRLAWILEPQHDGPVAWRLISSSTPARGIPGADPPPSSGAPNRSILDGPRAGVPLELEAVAIYHHIARAARVTISVGQILCEAAGMIKRSGLRILDRSDTVTVTRHRLHRKSYGTTITLIGEDGRTAFLCPYRNDVPRVMDAITRAGFKIERRTTWLLPLERLPLPGIRNGGSGPSGSTN
jgi:hypothetical protein